MCLPYTSTCAALSMYTILRNSKFENLTIFENKHHLLSLGIILFIKFSKSKWSQRVSTPRTSSYHTRKNNSCHLQLPTLTLVSLIKSSSWSVHRNPFTSRGSDSLSSSARRPHHNWRPLALRVSCKSRPRCRLLVARSQERSHARGEATTETSSYLVTTTPSVSTTAVYLVCVGCCCVLMILRLLILDYHCRSLARSHEEAGVTRVPSPQHVPTTNKKTQRQRPKHKNTK